nr:hypothetical protein [uncultured Dysosmobacter sp.]
MIYFKDWEISHDGSTLARQYDNLSRVLLVRGTPQGYDWEVRIRKGDWYEVIPLSPMEGDVGCVLTEKHLALWGWYSLQLVGTLQADGVTVRHSNVISVFVAESLTDGDWPASPSEFTRLESSVREMNGHPPIPGENGFWMLWELDSHSYKESAFPLPKGLDGVNGKDGTDGRNGVDGKDGVDGKTPIRGVDYWTEDDVSAMREYIDGRLGVVENGTY